MNIKEIKIDKIQIRDDNYKEIADDQLEALKKYLLKYGLLTPLQVWESKMQLLGGNQRLKAIKQLGWTEVECNLVEPKDESEAKEIALLDNNAFGYAIKEKLMVFIDGTDIKLDDFKVSFEDIELSDLKIENIDYSDKNKEIQTGDLGNEAILNFKFDHQTYLKVLDLMENAKEKRELETNEQLLLDFLKDYE